ncbi:MAG: SCO family protein [Moheibacter sp.]
MKRQIIFGLVLAIIIVGIVWMYRINTKTQLFTVMKVPSFELKNEDGQIITTEDLEGKVYVVEFFFTNCPTICPIMNQNLKKVEENINNSNFTIVSITIDPKRDTPKALKEHKEKLKISNPNWHFLTGSRDYIYRLSKKFNIYIGEDENTAEGLDHSGKFALVDREGNIRSRFNENQLPILYYSGLNFEDRKGEKFSLSGTYHPQIEWLIEDINKLLN